MSTAIAFLSGKGGSGKTTLALSAADLLSKCSIDTLLVDCDLSTNGATYFYEAKLVNRVNRTQGDVLTLSKVLSNNYEGGGSALHIKDNYDFIPSVSDFSGKLVTERIAADFEECERLLKIFFEWARSNYEVILFDCQAGYTEFLHMLLPLLDIDLFVMETDSISASAMRSLHLKAGDALGSAQLYQVFNKATPEEFEIYSKIVGTFFTNIGTLLFDWKIRQAFSRSQIPDLEHTSAKYGSDLCAIFEILLSDEDVHKRLHKFTVKLQCQKIEEECQRIEKALNRQTKQSSKSMMSSVIMITTFFLFFAALSGLILYAVWKPGGGEMGTDFKEVMSLIGLAFLLMLCFVLLKDVFSEREKQQRFKSNTQKTLLAKEKELKRLRQTIEDD